jgi:hypothetical protein
MGFALLQWADFAEATSIENAFNNHESDEQVKGAGRVIPILKDDHQAFRYQRFILKLLSEQTVLVAHNIDLILRIHSISNGEAIQFYGEYEWNNKGGVVHWTHRDPNGRHDGGWLKHNGKTYQ